MIRFTMPEAGLPLEERKALLRKQFDDFLKAEALEEILSVIGTDRSRLAEEYGGRRKPSGGIMEAQDMTGMPELAEIRARLFLLFRELGFFDIGAPRRGDHTRLLIYGGALGACYDRTFYSASLLSERTGTVDALTCYRPINPVERNRKDIDPAADTEAGALAEAMETAFGLGGGAWEESFSGDRNLNAIACRRTYRGGPEAPVFRVFAAPSSEPRLRRADTGDCIAYYLQQAGVGEGDSLLAVTSRRFCNRQFVQTAYELIRRGCPVDFDIVGCHRAGVAPTAESCDPLQYLQELIGILDWIERFRLL